MILDIEPDQGKHFPLDYAGNILFDENITDYVVNDVNLKRWLHVKIPLTFSKGNIRTLVFYENATNIPVSATVYLTDTQLAGQFRNIIGLDRIFLSRIDQPRFCSATAYPMWITDLDDDSYDLSKYGTTIPHGWLPCSFTPGYTWTGTQCCGDDQTYTFDETFVDSLDGCWRGLVVKNNTVVDISIK